MLLFFLLIFFFVCAVQLNLDIYGLYLKQFQFIIFICRICIRKWLFVWFSTATSQRNCYVTLFLRWIFSARLTPYSLCAHILHSCGQWEVLFEWPPNKKKIYQNEMWKKEKKTELVAAWFEEFHFHSENLFQIINN